MSRKGRVLPLERDCVIRDAEQAAYDYYGLERLEKRLSLESSAGTVDVRVSIFDGPSDRPPVVLLHGIGSSTVLAAPLIRFLSGRQVIALDWPGHGLSGPCMLSPRHDMHTHASSVVRSLLDELELHQVDLVGHSMGAQFSLYAALDLGERVRRVVLLGAPGAGFAGIRPLTAMKLLAVPRLGPRLLSRPMSDKVYHRFNDLALGVGALDRHSSDLRSALRLFADRTDNGASLASFFCAMVRNGTVREGVALSERELGRLTQPVLLAWGDDDVFMHPREAAASIVSIRDSHLQRFPAGHAPWLQAPYEVGTAVARHLDA